MNSDALNKDDLAQSIAEAMTNAKNGTPFQSICITPDSITDENQFCFFLKPGATEGHPTDQFMSVINIVLSAIEKFDLTIQRVTILSGYYLAKHKIIQRHYRQLYLLASDARSNLTAAMRANFMNCFNIEANDEDILGGFEFLAAFPKFNATSLDLLWSNLKHHKLGPSSFCSQIQVGNDTKFLINGFTPFQLSTYTPPDHALVTLTLSGSVSWHIARQYFLGAPNPQFAKPNSLRADLYSQRNVLKLNEVSLSKNGAHLSAGPVESLVELCLLGSDHDSGQEPDVSDYAFGRRLLQHFSNCEIDKLLNNSIIQTRCGLQTVFEATDGVEQGEAIDFLLAHRDQLTGCGCTPEKRDASKVR